MLMPSLEQLQKKESRNYNIKVYIEDDNLEWVDFSSRVKRKKDLVLEIPNIKRDADSRFISSSFISSASNLKVDNSDGFWEKPLDFTMKTEKGNTASFSKTKNESETVWCRRRIQFRFIESFIEQHFEHPIGTFLINEIESDLSSEATLNLVGLEKPLMERDASVVKNGQTWYQNRSISFLVKKLLELEYAKRNNGRLPNTFNILNRINLETFDGSKTNTTIGPPPMEVDTDDDDIANITLDNTKKARAFCIAPATISVATKDDPKNTLYLGCDEQLYSYNTATDLFTELTEISTLGTGYHIRYLWYGSKGIIYGVAYPDMTTDSDVPDKTWLTVTAKVFKYTNNSLTVIKTLTNFYDGKSYYRYGYNFYEEPPAGGGFHSIIGQTIYFMANSGTTNIFCPFSQYARFSSHDGVENPVKYKKQENYNSHETGADLTTFFANEADLPSFIEGFNVAIKQDGMLEFLRLSLGQQGCVCYNDDIETILYCKITNELDHKRYLYTFDLETETELNTTPSGIFLTRGSYSYNYKAFPVAAFAKKRTIHGISSPDFSQAGFYVSVVTFCDPESVNDENIGSSIFSEIRYYNAIKDTWSTYKAEAGKIPIEIYYNEKNKDEIDNDLELFVVYLNYYYWALSRYEIASYDYNMNNEVSIYKTNNQPKGLVIREEDSLKDLFFCSQQTGYINKYNLLTSENEVLDNGFPIVDNNTFLVSQLVIDEETRENDYILWGIASDSFDYQMTVTSSYNYMFKYDNMISEYLMLADFEGSSIWDALGLLAQRSNCVMGFDAKGDFFFQRRDINDNIIEITDKDVVSIKKERGLDNTFNFVEITPYEVKYESPEYELLLKERTEEEEENTISEEEINIKQLDTKTKEIALICVTDGDSNFGSSTESGFPLFKYRIYEVVIHGLFTSSVTAGSTLNISSTFGGDDTDFGIKTGYFLVNTDENEDEEYYLITAVDSTTNQITISGSVTVNKGDEFTVIRRNRLYDSIKDWSDEGVTFITTGTTSTEQTVNSLDALSINTYVLINNQYARITSVDVDTSTITLDTSIVTTTNDTVYAFFAPRVYSVFYEIGNTDVFLSIGSAGKKSIFKQGDRIKVYCKGLVIESDEKSKQLAISSSSVNLYGKKQYPNINNKFLTRKLAKQMADKIRTLYAFPKYVLTLTVPLYTFIDMINSTGEITTLKIRSKKLFPYREGFSETCYITSINHNFKSFMTQIECVAYNNY